MSDRWNGLLNIHKEAGWTSNDVVQKLRGIFGQRKIGHTGTLDPDATGVLVVCLGSATKLVELLTDHDKEYIAVCRLGITTDTQDTSGQILETADVSVTEEELRHVVRGFQGTYDQIPPMYSAIKVDGKRLYELARAGKEVERKARSVTIHALSVPDASHLQTEHVFTMEVRCSKGTYIRTLCHDIGQALGCGAAMAHLTRTAVAGFRLEDAYTMDDLQMLRDRKRLDESVLPVDRVFRDLDKLVITDEAGKQAVNGNAIRLNQLHSFSPENEQDRVEPENLYRNGERFRLYGDDNTFYGIYRYDAKKRVFLTDIFLYRP